VRSKPDSGFVEYVLHQAADADRLRSGVRYDRLVFARQLIFVTASIGDLPAGDRVAALMPVIAASRTAILRAVAGDSRQPTKAKELAAFLPEFACRWRRRWSARAC
jgi:23S rRNA (cytidine2498-2'-O)-methyltransferase